MPELPEVETIRLGLQRLIVQKTVDQVHNYTSPKSFPNSDADVSQFLLGASISNVRRRAKVLLIELSSQYTLMIHLKMTGQLVYEPLPLPSSKIPLESSHRSLDAGPDAVSAPTFASQALPKVGAAPYDVTRSKQWSGLYSNSHIPIAAASEARFGGGHPSDSLVGELPDRTTREHIEFSDGSRLYFNDLRKFGWMKLLPTAAVPEIDFMKKVGPEPLEAGFTAQDFIARIRRHSGTTVKAAILDQTVLAGVGNIYADESLWGAHIHPASRVRDLNDKQLARLLEQIKYVLKLSIEKGGSTDKNYVDAEGKKGSYLKFANVFRLEGQPCPRCGTTIEKIRVAGRGTHVCPVCQVVQ